jgi:hypothetical protein
MTPESAPEDQPGIPANADPDRQPSEEDGSDYADFTVNSRSYSKGFQVLVGKPGTAVKSDRYICPVPDCPTDWFRTRVGQTPPLCEDHGQVLVPEAPQS